RDASVAAAQHPRPAHLRAALDLGLDPAVARPQVEDVEAAADVHVAVAGIGLEPAVESRGPDRAVAGVKPDLTLQAVGGDAPVACEDAEAARDGCTLTLPSPVRTSRSASRGTWRATLISRWPKFIPQRSRGTRTSMSTRSPDWL